MRKLGLVVVHGIGEPTAGEALADFTDSLEEAGLARFASEQQQRRFSDRHQSSNSRTEFFPAPLKHGVTVAGDAIVATEVYWGSASQLRPGRLGVLQGVVSLMLNVPALVVGADERKGGFRGLVQMLCWWTSMSLSGPAFALNALLVVTLAVHAGGTYVFGQARSVGDLVVPLVAAAVTAALSFLKWPWFPETCWSFRLVGLLILTWIVARGALSTEAFAYATASTLEWVVGAVVVLLLASIAVYIVGRMARQLGRPSLTALLSVCLQFGLWVLLVPLTWEILLRGLPDAAKQPWMSNLFSRVAQSNGLQWLMFLVVAAVLAVVVAWRWLRETIEARRGGWRPAPRLIVHPAVAGALVIVTGIGALVIALVSLAGEIGAAPAWVKWLIELIPRDLPVAGALIVLVPLVPKQIRLALDLAHDVIFYIHHGFKHGRRVLSRRRVPEAAEMGPVRWRFFQVVNGLLKDNGVDRLVIVAHSQGTTIALDELTHSWESGELPPVSMLTFGSPITHLYGFYFPNVYPEWTDPQWNTFFERVRRWANFYRLGDYVGTIITPPDRARCDFTQATIGAGAHNSYFRDPRLLAALKEWNLFG